MERKLNRPGIKHWLFAVLIILTAISPFIELRAISHYIPARWSDSYSPWYAAKVAIQGVNPYSDQVTRDIQTRFYGQPLDPIHPQHDLQAFVYPATAIPLFAPLTWLPWKINRILFLAVAPLLLLVSYLYWAGWSEAFHNRPMRWAVAVLATASVPSFWAIYKMQPTVLVFVGVTAVVALISMGRYAWAGTVLGFVSIKPNLVFLLGLWLLVVMARQRRWRFIVSFGMVFALLSVIANLLVPAWPWKWYRALVTYTGHKTPIFGFVFGHYATVATLVAGVLLLVALSSLGFPQPRSRKFGLAISLLLAYTVCIIPSGPWMVYNQIFLVPPVLYLVSIKGSSAVPHIMRIVAIGFVWLVIFSVVICSVLLLTLGPSLFAIRFPFSIYLLPVSVLIALFLVCWDVVRPRVSATRPGEHALGQPSQPFAKAASTPARP